MSSDEDAVTKWKAGEATAKEFTKENVTLQEGDTVLVLDKDTYATTDVVEAKSKKTGTAVTYVAVKENIYDGTSTDIYGMTYAILRENYTAIKDIGDDGVLVLLMIMKETQLRMVCKQENQWMFLICQVERINILNIFKKHRI